jgi:hypothetical protein
VRVRTVYTSSGLVCCRAIEWPRASYLQWLATSYTIHRALEVYERACKNLLHKWQSVVNVVRPGRFLGQKAVGNFLFFCVLVLAVSKAQLTSCTRSLQLPDYVFEEES